MILLKVIVFIIGLGDFGVCGRAVVGVIFFLGKSDARHTISVSELLQVFSDLRKGITLRVAGLEFLQASLSVRRPGGIHIFYCCTLAKFSSMVPKPLNSRSCHL